MAINPRLQAYLDRTRSSYAVLPHEEVFTAQEVAERAHVTGGHVAKVVVVREGGGRDVMVVIPATRLLDIGRLRRATGFEGVALEDERELLHLFPDCEVGAMPPFGQLYGMPMYVDPCLLRGDDIFFQAGTHRELVLMRVDEYRRIAHPFEGRRCMHRQPAMVA